MKVAAYTIFVSEMRGKYINTKAGGLPPLPGKFRPQLQVVTSKLGLMSCDINPTVDTNHNAANIEITNGVSTYQGIGGTKGNGAI